MSGHLFELSTATQRTTLTTVLGLNLLLVLGFTIGGVFGDSNGLIANALDNASHSAVYVISLLALSRSGEWKRTAAKVSGVLLLLLAAGVVIDAVRRFVMGAEPLGLMMMALAVVAAVVNAICLSLLKRLRNADVNVRAARTFSANDFVSNIGILVGGALVLWTGRLWPDLAVGVAVAGIAVKGGVDILRDAHEAG